jgi:hypothetical protein
MKRTVIMVVWMLGMAVIAWSCSHRQGTAHSSSIDDAGTGAERAARHGVGLVAVAECA